MLKKNMVFIDLAAEILASSNFIVYKMREVYDNLGKYNIGSYTKTSDSECNCINENNFW